MSRTSRTLNLLTGIGALVLLAHLASANPFESTGLALTGLDLQKISMAAQPLLADQSLPIGTKRTWSNIRSGNHGSIWLLGRFYYEHSGTRLSCRKLMYQLKVLPPSDPYNLTLNQCRIKDGAWEIL
jgi:surface antigen